jgi:hypothetical protein
MELAVWLANVAVPLLGWWLLTKNFQKLASVLQRRWAWNESFQHDFFKSFLISFCHATPENHCESLKTSSFSLRIRLLWLGLRSLSYGFVFIVLFGLWNFVPAPVFLLLGLVTFLIAQWWKPMKSLALFFLGLGVFIGGFETLLSTSARLTQAEASPEWVYWLAQNYLQGALIGILLGALIRFLTRMSGVAWWTGLNLLLAGILSLGGAWGFFLGDFLMALLEDYRRHSEKDFRLRFGLAAGFGLTMLLLSSPFQQLILSWINGEYSVQLRSLQLGLMIFLFLLLESSLALGFFHFYFLKKRQS